jgi:putative restriction endonuclease
MRQYGGNAGYEDDPSSVYRYDSNVSNYRQVSEGDVIVVRSRIKILGMARIEKILTGEGEKERLRCPVCGISQIKERATMQPRWACQDHHAFDTPKRETVGVKRFEAHYSGTFRPAPRALTLQQLNDAVMRPSDQMSIKELDLAKFEDVLLNDIGCHQLVIEYADAIGPDATAQIGTDFEMPRSIIEARRRVLREVNLRRGQPQFRERLVRRYGKACQISLCAFPGLIEAAHITPYARTNENGVHNGLLLRSDLHTLFDLGLLAIDPATMTVALHPALLEMGYGTFDGAPLFTNGTSGPDHAALTERWEFFRSRLSYSEEEDAA